MELSATEWGIGIIAAGYILDKAGGWFLKFSKNGKLNDNNKHLTYLQQIAANTGDIKEDVGDTRDDCKMIRSKVEGQHEVIRKIEVWSEKTSSEASKNTNTLDALHRRIDDDFSRRNR